MERRRFALPQKFICLQSIDLEAQQQAQQQQHQQGPGFSAINPKQVIDIDSKTTSNSISPNENNERLRIKVKLSILGLWISRRRI